MNISSKVSIAIVGLATLLCLSPPKANGQATLSDSAQVALSVTSKPKAAYTETASKKNVEGVVRLRIEFLASGEIGQIVDITRKKRGKLVRYGLTASAIDAAKRIKFEPAKKNGVPITVTRTFEYFFTRY